MKKAIFSIIYLFLVAFCCISCNENMKMEDYLDLSISSYVFRNDGNDSVAVRVYTNLDEWTVDTDCDYLSISKIGTDSVVIKSAANESEQERNASVIFSSGDIKTVMEVVQMPKTFNGVFKHLPITSRGAMSRNGKWYVYVDVSLIDNEWVPKAYKIDLKNDVTTEIDLPQNPNSSYYNSVYAVSDDGESIIFADEGGYDSDIYCNGNLIPLSIPSGYTSKYLTNFSSDATIAVGSCKMGDRWYPFKWVNGEPVALEYPETDLFGKTAGFHVYVRGCSADGSVIYGSEWRHKGVMYWKNEKLFNIGMDNSEIVVTERGQKYVSIMMLTAVKWAISPDGKYIGATYRKYDSNATYVDYPVRINTEMGIYEVMESCPDCGAQMASDNGLIFGATPTTLSSYGCVYDIDNDVMLTLSDWMSENNGFIMSTPFWCNNMSYDMKSFSGRSVVSTAAGIQNAFWVISLD